MNIYSRANNSGFYSKIIMQSHDQFATQTDSDRIHHIRKTIMVERCAEKNLIPSLVDGSDIQIDALSWLMQQHGINE